MRIFWAILFLTIPVLGVAVFVAAVVSGSAWLPENISTTGREIDNLFYLILGITGFFFVLTEVLLVWAMFHGRGKNNGKGDYYHGHHTLEISWTLVTSAILLFIALYQLPTWAKAKISDPSDPSGTKVADALVTASQFVWQVRYPVWDEKAGKPMAFEKNWTRNPNYNQTFELRNELHVPVGEMVLIHLTTRDVIHSFWLQNARVKQDALPGHLIPVWFDTTKTGNYEWVCAELCGWGHYRMRGKLVVHEKADYENWLKEQTRQMTSAATE